MILNLDHVLELNVFGGPWVISFYLFNLILDSFVMVLQAALKYFALLFCVGDPRPIVVGKQNAQLTLLLHLIVNHLIPLILFFERSVMVFMKRRDTIVLPVLQSDVQFISLDAWT